MSYNEQLVEAVRQMMRERLEDSANEHLVGEYVREAIELSGTRGISMQMAIEEIRQRPVV